MSDKAVKKAAKKLVEQIKRIQKPDSGKEQYKMIQNYNSKVMGIHNYYKIATRICLDCRKMSIPKLLWISARPSAVYLLTDFFLHLGILFCTYPVQ